MTELTRPQLARLYREFSRQKYNKYRHQFPRMRESELVSKIIKEWEALSSKEKEVLYETYMAEKHISEDRSESSEEKRPSPGQSKSKALVSSKDSSSKMRSFQKKTPNKKEMGNIKVFVRSSSSKKEKEQLSQSSDFARDGAKKDFEISQSDSKELGRAVGGKRKRIAKRDYQPKTEYLKFFKFYYEKLSSEHPRWSANQISTIIKLLWKKKQTTDKITSRAASLRAPKERTKISGRMAFRKMYNYSGIEGAERWKQLPFESKEYWRSKGMGLISGEKRVFIPNIKFDKMSRKSSDSDITVSGKPFVFLSRSIGA